MHADRRGAGYGTFHTIFGVCWFAGSALMGFLYDQDVMLLVVFSVVAQLLAVPVFLMGRPKSVIA